MALGKDQWSPKRITETQYQKALSEIADNIQESITDMSDPFDITAKIKNLIKNMGFHRYAESTATRIVTRILTDSSQTWRMAARESTLGRSIYEALRKELQGPVGGMVVHQVQRNAEIIKSLPLDLARQVTDYIQEETFKGRRASEIAKDIQLKLPDISRIKANLIARTETSKTSTALTRARAENIGLDWYIWRTSKDSRVRDSHELMEGILVKWTDPPSPERLDGQKNPPAPYNPGEIYNCRCYPEPVISLDYVKWPHKVFRNGAITMMTRNQFEQLVA
ncbi:phage minor head protein [Paradesulfitobacterium aromaticivorans]